MVERTELENAAIGAVVTMWARISTRTRRRAVNRGVRGGDFSRHEGRGLPSLRDRPASAGESRVFSSPLDPSSTTCVSGRATTVPADSGLVMSVPTTVCRRSSHHCRCRHPAHTRATRHPSVPQTRVLRPAPPARPRRVVLLHRVHPRPSRWALYVWMKQYRECECGSASSDRVAAGDHPGRFADALRSVSRRGRSHWVVSDSVVRRSERVTRGRSASRPGP
jgi:hypothetical protein